MNGNNFIELVPAVFAAGESKTFIVAGQYFELIDCPSPVDVYLVDRYGAQRGVMRGAEASFNLKATEFNQVQIVSAVAQSVRFAYGSGEGGTRRAAGSVNVANTAGAFTQAAATVTNTAANLLAARANRRYLLIQNKDAAGIVYVNLAGAAATVGNGIAIEPGGSMELQGFVCTGAISAIGSIPSNTNVVVVEG